MYWPFLVCDINLIKSSTTLFQTGKGVPIIVPHAWRDLLKYVTDPTVRRESGILSENKYIFAASRKSICAVFNFENNYIDRTILKLEKHYKIDGAEEKEYYA